MTAGGLRDTSLEAYDYIQKRGVCGRQCIRIAAYLLNHGPLTRKQISVRMDIAINAVCGRVKELIDAEVLEEGDRCKCPVTGHNARPVGVTARYKQKDLFGDAA